MVDALTIVVSGAVGLGLGGLVTYYVFYSRAKTVKKVVPRPQSAERSAESTVTDADLERSRREMRTIMVERDLLSSAMMKLYEAETEGRITRDEREMISKRYSAQIREIESKLTGRELTVEVGELEGLRDELVTLFTEKISNIETRLDQARERLPSLAQPEVKREAPAPSTRKAAATVAATASQSAQGEDLERAVERKAPKRDDTEGERRVKAIRDEVMDALERLEQIDSRKENDSS